MPQNVQKEGFHDKTLAILANREGITVFYFISPHSGGRW